MKKIRYLAGVAGLVPAAAALAVPVAAHAAAGPQAARPGSQQKTVSVHLIRSGPSAGKDTGCAGGPQIGPINHNHASATFWYEPNLTTGKSCIGTVHIQIYGSNLPTGNSCYYPQIHVYGAYGSTYAWSSSSLYCDTYFNKFVGVHRSFNGPVGVFVKGYLPSQGANAGPAGTDTP